MRSPRAVLSNVNPVRTKRSLLNISRERPHSSRGLSELQQPFHTAGVFLYMRGGSVCGACQDVQNFILPFQLSLRLQGKAFQLHQHLRTHICNQISKNIHLRVQTHSSNCTKNPSEHEQLRSKTQIKEKTCRKPSSCRVEHVDHMCRGVITGSVR